MQSADPETSMRGFRTIATIVAFILACLLAAMTVMAVVGRPSGSISWLAYLGSVFVLCLVGPPLFAWAMGPGAMGPLAILVAFLFPSLSLGILYFGFIRARSLRWLATSAAIWGAFGGFSAWVAIMGSV